MGGTASPPSHLTTLNALLSSIHTLLPPVFVEGDLYNDPYIVLLIFNPRRACAARVTVVVFCVCVSLCVSVRTRYSGSTRD